MTGDKFIEEEREGARLVIVPTPIGNLEDITLRALRCLKEADYIACEDTRHTGRLLDHFEIRKPLISYHDHNEKSRAQEIVDLLVSGKRVCLVSDAGMPAISDPGRELILRAQACQIPYTVLPGPSAMVTAYVASALGDGKFSFYGFLDRKGKGREELLSIIDQSELSSVVYEAPHRIRKTLREFLLRWPKRNFSVCRELTKLYEDVQVFLGMDLEVENFPEKGEYVIIIGPADKQREKWSKEQVMDRLFVLQSEKVSSKELLQILSEESGWRKNELYPLHLEAKVGAAGNQSENQGEK